ncbi:hypothetical protein [Pedobacter panaciterrae]
MMEGNWKRRTVADPARTAKLAIAKDAAIAGCLIYSNETGNWYTPKQFMESKERVNIHRGKDDSEKKFRIRIPEAGIKEKMEVLRKAQDDLQNFIALTTEYFEMQAKQKLNS